jgi:hypothetical protein
MSYHLIDLTGKQIGAFTVMCYLGIGHDRHAYWLVRCSHGREQTKRSQELRRNKNVVCKCSSEFGKKHPKEHDVWSGMIERCHGKHPHKNYAGRGITVCDRWRESFEDFFVDMGKRPNGWHRKSGRARFSLERINNNGNYEPENCRWATSYEQGHNKRNNLDWSKHPEIVKMKVSRQRKKQLFNHAEGKCYACSNPIYGAGLCEQHYRQRYPNRTPIYLRPIETPRLRHRTNQTQKGLVCSCGLPASAVGKCAKCYHKQWREIRNQQKEVA